MNKFATIKIDDSMINDYLFYRNLFINRKFASSKKKIKKIDHYQWWFKSQKKRHSFLILKNNNPIFISASDHFKFKNHNLIYSGLYSCLEETNLFDILKSIKIQNEYLDKQKNKICFISINNNNKVLMQHWKYFKYKPLLKKNIFFKYVKKFLSIGDNSSIFYKKIS
ncbi:hypothetical protein N9570_04740 [Candidatus Pelagibacter sp.]|nr:hypothetical protein [Candidatus Pelagibacter sp.]